ncbi:MAG: PaaI family thioesterase [Corynebacterium sp.]|nr:PaaI family thioesterase [Corynebacterium sp.]
MKPFASTFDLFAHAAHTPLGAAELEQYPQLASPLDRTLGTHYIYASAEKVEAEITVTDALTQPWGVAHGGVYAALAESVGSMLGILVGGGVTPVVGVNNNTNFLRPVQVGGKIHAVATVISAGKTTQLLRVTMTSDHRLVAESTLRTIVMAPRTADLRER